MDTRHEDETTITATEPRPPFADEDDATLLAVAARARERGEESVAEQLTVFVAQRKARN